MDVVQIALICLSSNKPTNSVETPSSSQNLLLNQNNLFPYQLPLTCYPVHTLSVDPLSLHPPPAHSCHP